MEKFEGGIEFGNQVYTFTNPDLTIINNNNTYRVIGEVSRYTGDLSVWGFDPPTDYVFVLKLTVDNADANATVKLTGEHHTKTITKSDFDGADFVYLVLDGNMKTYTVEAKASVDEEPVTIIIDNKATLGA